MQLCLKSFISPESDFIYKEVGENCLKICSDKHGCCIVQKCLAAGTSFQRVCCSSMKIVERAYKQSGIVGSRSGQGSICELRRAICGRTENTGTKRPDR